jgi:hypothetical protein
MCAIQHTYCQEKNENLPCLQSVASFAT